MTHRSKTVSFAANLLNLEAMQEDVVSVVMTVTNDGAPWDPADVVIEAGIIVADDAVLAIPTAATTGTLVLHFTELLGAALRPGRYRWYLKVWTDDVPRTWLGGLIDVLPLGFGRQVRETTVELAIVYTAIDLEITAGASVLDHALLSGLLDDDHPQYLLRSEAVAGFVFTQLFPASTWTINHNLGFRPIVEVYDGLGIPNEALVTHTSLNQAVVLLNGAMAGTARCV